MLYSMKQFPGLQEFWKIAEKLIILQTHDDSYHTYNRNKTKKKTKKKD